MIIHFGDIKFTSIAGNSKCNDITILMIDGCSLICQEVLNVHSYQIFYLQKRLLSHDKAYANQLIILWNKKEIKFRIVSTSWLVPLLLYGATRIIKSHAHCLEGISPNFHFHYS